MHQLSRLRLLLLALPALLAACAPSYYLGLRPARPTNLFVEGREQARAVGADSVEVRLNFVCFEPSRMVFEAVYRNPTRGQRLVVAPTAFACLPSRPETAAALPSAALARRPKPAPGTTVSAAAAAASVGVPLPLLPALPVAAFDPEPEITQLQATAAREAAKARRVDWLGAALALTSVAVDVRSLGQRETRSQAQSRAALHDAVVTYQVASTAGKIGHALAADALRLRALNLQDYALRQVTLEPGQQVRGLLYFPRFDHADAVRVLAPVPGGGALPLDFVQTRTRR